MGLTKSTGGTVTLVGANTYSGATTINAGTLSVSDVADTGTNSNLGTGSSLVIGDGRLQFSAAASDSTNRAVTLSHTGDYSTVEVSDCAGEPGTDRDDQRCGQAVGQAGHRAG